MVSDIAPVRAEALGTLVAKQLRDRIVRGEFAPGIHLAEDTLAEQFNVSRGPVRDALQRLQAEGLVESRRRKIFTLELSPDDIRDQYALREAVETLAVRLAIERATPEQWDQGRVFVERMRVAARSEDHDAFARADTAFHSYTFALARHRRLEAVWQQSEPILTALLEFTVQVDTDLEASAEDHAELLDLMSSGHIGRSVEEVSAHIHRSCERMVSSYRLAVTRQQNPAAG
ncbi:GntR family transcriptional regulator of gluconate operon [Mycetocola sp. CAN_C7]|uniref:GntR family transcriptional regulator n=1 Tax=Mycetocola sp. CAN_C7 TaxID=2787724 RepID=UPI0018CB41FF